MDTEMDDDPIAAAWQASQPTPKKKRVVDPIEAAWRASQSETPPPAAPADTSPSPARVESPVERRARIAAVRGKATDLDAATGDVVPGFALGPDASRQISVGVRSFAGAMEGVGKTIARGVGQIAGNLGDTLAGDDETTLSTLVTGKKRPPPPNLLQRFGGAADRAAAALGRHQAGVVPTPEEEGRYPLTSAAAATVGEAAPQFLLGEIAGAATAPLTRMVGRAVPGLAPSLGPATMDAPVVAGAKAFGRAVVPQAAVQTAAFAPLAKDEPVSPMGLGMSLLGSLGDAAGAYQGGMPARDMADAGDAKAVWADKSAQFQRVRDAREQAMARTQARAQIMNDQTQGTPLAGISSRVPAEDVPARMVRAGLARQDVPVPDQWTQGQPTPDFGGEPVSVGPPSYPSARRAGGGIDETKLARPMADEAPISTGDTRSSVDLIDSILNKSRVRPPGEVAPPADTPFPDGYSTPSNATTRRPGAVPAPETGIEPYQGGLPPRAARIETPAEPVLELAAPVPDVSRETLTPSNIGPESVPVIDRPVSVGRDLNAPPRIPADAPTEPTAAGRGVNPSGTVETPEGVVSVGPHETTVSDIPELPERASAATATPDDVLGYMQQREGVRSGQEPPLRTPEDAIRAATPDTPDTVSGVGAEPVTGTGETKTRGLARGVEAKAVEKQLTTSLGDLPEYRTVKMADQAERATKLLSDDPDLARKIARGEAPPPADLLPESVFVAVENKAIAEGDVATLRDLASGKLTEQATTMGQRIRTLAERNPESPVAAMQRIVDARTKGVKDATAATKASVGELQRHIAEAAKMDPSAWSSFIDGLRC